MKSPIRTRFIAAAALALGALGAMSAAHARSDLSFFVDVQAPVYVGPAPVFVRPQPVYVQPRPVYVRPHPVYTQPQVYPVYQYDRYAEECARREAEWRRWQWRHRHHHGHHGHHDWDRGDGRWYGRDWH